MKKFGRKRSSKRKARTRDGRGRGTRPPTSIEAHHREWLNLIEVEGPFLSIPVLKAAFPDGLDDPEDTKDKAAALRSGIEEWGLGLETGESSTIHRDWVAFVLRYVLDLDDEVLRTASDLPPNVSVPIPEHSETLAPDWVVVDPKDTKDDGTPRLLVQMVPPDQELDAPIPGKRWKASPADRMAELLRGAGQKGVPLGLLTNGSRWMLVHAPRADTVGRATWDAVLWIEERITLRAFRSLLGLARFFVGADQRLDALLAKSAEDQQSLTDQLGAQVRRAVEVIIHSFDRLDRDTNRELLKSIEPRTLYEASVTVMMRLVFLLYAEEQLLLPLEDPLYSKDYSASKLLDQLQEEADRHGPSILERRHSAWSRLLATFRVVHGGVEHEAMRLPAYGGGLFDPDRYPFLEGRADGTSWRNTPAQPLAIDDHTVLQILGLLQWLGSKGFDGRGTEAVRLSFKGLGVEQIGHVYEGLLDHTAVRASQPVLGLQGKTGQEPEISIPDLDRERRRGQKHFLEYLKDTTQRSEKSLEKALAYVFVSDDSRWLVACDNDSKLLEMVEPYAGVVRNDPSGQPVVIAKGSIYVTKGSDRRSTGAHYTPPSLTEPIAKYTLEPLVYAGPAEGKPEREWKLRSPREILALRVCDLAMGSGAFLVAACRYLAERLVEAWEECENARPGQILVTPEGDLSNGEPREALVPSDAIERLAAARRFVSDRCLYGVDKDPMAVEMGKLSLWLVTLQKGKPFSFLDHALKNGDSLLGVSRREQLESFDFSIGGGSQGSLFGPLVGKAMEAAREKRERLERLAVNDVRDTVEKSRLLREVGDAIKVAKLAGDLLTGAALSTACDKGSAYDSRRDTLADALGRAVSAAHDETLAELNLEASQLLDEGRPETEGTRRPFHWPLEFPEVFDGGGFHAFVGNPPFMGGAKISGVLGDDYLATLLAIHSGASGNADLSAFFLRRAASLTREQGCIGFVTTNSISQGSSRETALDFLLSSQFSIYRANKSLVWPGGASVLISMIHLIMGQWGGVRWLDGVAAFAISSYLDESAPRFSIQRLKSNLRKVFRGSTLGGEGFVLEQEEKDELISANPACSAVIKRFITGQDVNQAPEQSGRRFVIDLGDQTEEEAQRLGPIWVRLFNTVRVQRERNKLQGRRNYWWRYIGRQERLYTAIQGFSRVLACGEVSKYWTVSWIAANHVFANKVVVFAFDTDDYFSLLSSCFHVEWAEKTSSRLKGDPSYVLADTFETFPFPSTLTHLASVGARFSQLRARLMRARGEGLTSIYNHFHDPGDSASELGILRALQAEMDEAVASAYGWGDLDLGHDFHLTEQGTRFTVSDPARREVLNRLLELNHQRYSEEISQGLHERSQAKTSRRPQVNAALATQPTLFGAPDDRGHGSQLTRRSRE